MDFKKEVIERLQEHAGLVSAGIPSDQALRIVCNSDVSFTAEAKTKTDILRTRLNFVVSDISQTFTGLLYRCSEAQLDRVVLGAEDVNIINPMRPNSFMRLGAIAHLPGGKWIFEFDDRETGLVAGRFVMQQIFLTDVLSLLEVVERVLMVEPRNTEI